MSSIYKRNGVWYYQDYRNGRNIRKSLKTSNREVAKAKQNLLDSNSEYVEAGLHTKTPVDDYLIEYQANFHAHIKPLTAKKDLYRLRNFIKFVGVPYLQDITSDLIRDYLNSLGDISPKTWNNQHGVIHIFLKRAVPKYLSKNPCEDVLMKKVPETSVIFYSDDEYKRIEDASKIYRDANFFYMIALARYTGLRIAEICHLESEDFFWQGKPLLKVQNKPKHGFTVKNYQNRMLPVSTELAKKIEPLQLRTGFLFTNKYGGLHKKTPNRQLNEILEIAGVKREGRGWHLLRHTFASRAVQEGIPLYTIMRWLGHGDYATTMKYAHLSPDYCDEINKINLTAKPNTDELLRKILDNPPRND